MKATLEHIELNVSNFTKSKVFYQELLSLLGYAIFIQDEGFAEWKNDAGLFAIRQTDKKHITNKYHRKNTGINHVAFRVDKKEDVDRVAKELLLPQKIKTLYNTPKEFPDYESNYYAVFCEDPDRIKIEVCYY